MRTSHAAFAFALLATAMTGPATAQGPTQLAASPSPAVLSSSRTDIRLTNAASLATAAGRDVVLRMQGLKADETPGVAYNVYLNLPAGRAPEGTGDAHYLGTFSFFGAEGRERTVEIDITDALKRLANASVLNDATLTIVPAGAPSPSAKPQIAQIQITAR